MILNKSFELIEHLNPTEVLDLASYVLKLTVCFEFGIPVGLYVLERVVVRFWVWFIHRRFNKLYFVQWNFPTNYLLASFPRLIWPNLLAIYLLSAVLVGSIVPLFTILSVKPVNLVAFSHVWRYDTRILLRRSHLAFKSSVRSDFRERRGLSTVRVNNISTALVCYLLLACSCG